MDKIQEMVNRNTIIQVITGSYLYGTATIDSDIDRAGVFLADPEYILGLNTIKEKDMSIKSKDKNGKNTKDAMDMKLYELTNFLRLALANNPNIIELFYVPVDKIEYINDVGTKLKNLWEHIICKTCFMRFSGYAFSQKKKLFAKKKTIENIKEMKEILDELAGKYESDTIIDVIPDFSLFWDRTKGNYKLADIKMNRQTKLKSAVRMMNERYERVTHREELLNKYGYDTKFAMHLIRLFYECRLLLKHGWIIFPLPEKETLLTIRDGKWDINEVSEEADRLDKECKDLYDNCNILPDKPNFNKVNEFVIKTHYNFITKGE